MKQQMMDVLVYVFENYLTEHYSLTETRHRKDIISGLQQIGFHPGLIEEALTWLSHVSETERPKIAEKADSLRHFSETEWRMLGDEGVHFIEYLQEQKILNAETRELLIDGLLYLKADNIDVDDLQWLVLIILFSQPDQEHAFADLERLLFEPSEEWEH